MISVPLLTIILLSTVLMALNLADKNPEILFKSVGNDSAEIELNLFDNEKFTLNFRTLNDNKSYRWKGSWFSTDDKIYLAFRWPTKLDLPKLFDQLDPQHKVEFRKTRSLSFSSKQKGLWIWGIYCNRIL